MKGGPLPIKADPKTAAVLETAYTAFHSHFYRERDPVARVHRFKAKSDQEVAAFFSACLAYGNVATILRSVDCVLRPLGNSPYATVLEGKFQGMFDGFRHRFTTGHDIEILSHWLKSALTSHGSLESFFVGGKDISASNMREMLSSFVRRFTSQPLPEKLKAMRKKRERNLMYLVSDPERGSACKRMNLFLRWMVRQDDGIDLGLWKGVRSSQLMLPVDTHLLKALLALRWTKSQTATWRTVETATSHLKLYSPEDPVRYDFALCHLSMEGKQVLDFRDGQRVR